MTGVSRRAMLVSGLAAGGALLVGWGWRQLDDGDATEAFGSSSSGSAALNPWIKIAPDGLVTRGIHRAEMGQGIVTTIAMILAEELDADWAQVRYEFTPVDRDYYNFGFVGRGQPLGDTEGRPFAQLGTAAIPGVMHADGRLEVRAPTQAPSIARSEAPRVAGLEPARVTFHSTLLGGGFGRRAELDYVVAAATLAMRMPGVPVQAFWSRFQDLRHDMYRPAAALPRRCTTGLPRRSPSWVANWPCRSGSGAALRIPTACSSSRVSSMSSHGSVAAPVIHVRAAPTLRVLRVTTVLDCGRVVRPDGVRAQVEGSVVDGLWAALRCNLRIEAGQVVQGNFHDYPLLRSNEVPPIDVQLIGSTLRPGGVGEPALPAVAPALCSAIFAATGQRIRRLPSEEAIDDRTE